MLRFLALLLIAVPAFADPLVVKIESENLASGEVMRGSGILVGDPKSAAILTSDHVFFHANAGVQTTVSWLEGEQLVSRDAFMVTADWGKGLGLLRLRNSTPSAEVIAGLRACRPADRKKVTFHGYPADSHEVLEDPGARYLQTIDAREYFVETSSLDVYATGHAEFGMSGGIALGEGGCFAGVLSHQRVDANGRNEILVIPAGEVREWLTRWGVGGDRFQPTFFEDLVAQTSPIRSVVTGGTRFSFYDPAQASDKVLETWITRKGPGGRQSYRVKVPDGGQMPSSRMGEWVAEEAGRGSSGENETNPYVRLDPEPNVAPGPAFDDGHGRMKRIQAIVRKWMVNPAFDQQSSVYLTRWIERESSLDQYDCELKKVSPFASASPVQFFRSLRERPDGVRGDVYISWSYDAERRSWDQINQLRVKLMENDWLPIHLDTCLETAPSTFESFAGFEGVLIERFPRFSRDSREWLEYVFGNAKQRERAKKEGLPVWRYRHATFEQSRDHALDALEKDFMPLLRELKDAVEAQTF